MLYRADGGFSLDEDSTSLRTLDELGQGGDLWGTLEVYSTDDTSRTSRCWLEGDLDI